jgi:ankyrin repeat protein
LDIGAVESYDTSQPSKDSTLAIAIRHRNSELFHLLFDSGVVRRDADVLAKSIEVASQVGMYGVVPTLLSAGKTYKAFANLLGPAVKAAVAAGNFDLVKMLLQVGARADVATLVTAIRIKDISIVKMLLKAGTPVNQDYGADVIKDSGNDDYFDEYDDSSDDDYLDQPSFTRDTTPLQAAAKWGKRSLVRRLLEQGADVDGNRPLAEAIRRQDSTLVSMLLDAGVPINGSWRSDTPTPLQIAVHYGDPSLVQILLDHHADVHGSGTTLPPLHEAIRSHRYDLVQMLLHAGADINDPAAMAHGSSALRLAIDRNDKPMVGFLLANGADPNDSKALSAAAKKADIKLMGGLLTARSRKYLARGRGFGCEALRATIRLASMELMDLLLSNGVDPNVVCHGQTALGTAIALDRSPDLKIIKKLLLAKADPNIPMETYDGNEQDETALLKAIESKSMPLMELLIQFGANINAPARGQISETPLQAACKSGNLKAVKLLLSLGAEINAPPALRNGATALQFAAISGHVGIASLLLDNGADVNAPAVKFNGRTALEGAAEHGRIDMLSLLLHAGACIEGPGNVQYSRALQFAARNGHKAVGRLLESFALRHTG